MSAVTESPYEIRLARPADLARLAAIELAAARLLVGWAPDSVLWETTPIADLETARAADLLWVASIGDEPVGFAHLKHIEPGSVHLDELDVHPDHGRRGVGRRLVTTVCEQAASEGVGAVTLSTFRNPPWNRPFYASIGFEDIASGELSDALSAIVADEARRGLDPEGRVVMRRRL